MSNIYRLPPSKKRVPIKESEAGLAPQRLSERETDQDAPSVRRRVAGALFLLLLVATTLIVTQHIRQASELQDCVTSGRRDCIVIPEAGPKR